MKQKVFEGSQEEVVSFIHRNRLQIRVDKRYAKFVELMHTGGPSAPDRAKVVHGVRYTQFKTEYWTMAYVGHDPIRHEIILK